MKEANLNLAHSSARRASARRLISVFCCLVIFGLAAWLAFGPVEAATQRRAPQRRQAAQAPRRAKAKKASRQAARDKSAEPPDEPRAEEGEHDGDDPEGRGRWFYFKRSYPSGEIPAEARRRAWESRPKRAKSGVQELNAQAVWQPIGPAPTFPRFPNNWGLTSGRINAVAVSPADPQVVLVGGSTGGVWRSTDGGEHFAPTSDDQIELAIGSIAFAPSNASIVYAGMGDSDNAYFGTGVLKSTNGGVSWTRVSNATLPALGFVMDIAVDPSNPNRVYVTQDRRLNTSTNPTTPNTLFTSGFYVSNDGGVSWTKTLAGQARGIAQHPTDAQTLYAAMRSVDGGGTPGIYKSTNAGASWALIYTSPFSGTTTRDIRVATTAADPGRVYAYVGRTAAPAQLNVEVSTDGGQTWSARGPGGVVGVDPGQFGYNTYLYASPADANTVYVGGRDVYKSTDGGQSWTNITKNFHYTVNPDTQAVSYPYNPTLSNTHPDQQSFAFSPGNANVIYAGNDGGLSKSTDGGQSFFSLNATLSLTQFVHLSVHPTDPTIAYGGTQDNGTQRRLGGSPAWMEFNEGDGGRSVVNVPDPSIVFSTYVFGAVRRNLNYGQAPRTTIANEATFGESPSAPRIAFYAPLTGNGVDQKLYFGSWRLFICTNCNETNRSAFTTPPTDWTAPGGTFDLTKGGTDVLNAIGVARSNTNVIYTGSVQGRAMVSVDGGANWTDITAGLPNRAIESITVDPSNASAAYLTVSGYGSGHVFKTTNAGASWTDVSGNLPNVPANAFVFDPLTPSTVYVGTDVGVFRSTSGGTTWETFNDGMPPVVVTAFAAQPGGRIMAATYGRGAYEFNQSAPAPPLVSFEHIQFPGSEASGRATLTVTRTSGAGAASVDYATSNETASERTDYTTARGTIVFAPGETSKSFDVYISDDTYQEQTEWFNVTLSNPSNVTIMSAGQVTGVIITDNDTASAPSPVKWGPSFSSHFFVRQHYLDFLGREPDAAGLAHWKNQIDECATAACTEARRINVSAAFFLAIEFQETGYLSYRAHKAAFGDLPGKPVPITFHNMLFDIQQLGRGVIVGTPGWAEKLDANKVAYFDNLAASSRFNSLYASQSTADYVNILNQNAGNPLDDAERNALVNSGLTRAQILRAVSEDQTLKDAELRKAFVLMQYFGYLRRNPDDVGFGGQADPLFEGYHHWLGKLNQHNGNFVSAEMVKAFIISFEYNDRFGQ